MIKRILNWIIGPKVAPKSEEQRVKKFMQEFTGDRSDTPRRVKPTRERYVCGLAFHGDGPSPTGCYVVLIRKIKPEWQKNKLNGVGGKIEPGESPEQAMAREYTEEAGIISGSMDWAIFARCIFRGADVIFLRSFDEAYSRSKTMTAETIEHRAVFSIDEIPEGRIIPNLRWLIPLAWHFEPSREVVTVVYDGNK